jgi:hypothetical protein
MPAHDIGYCPNRCGYRVKRESTTRGRTADLTYPLRPELCPTCSPAPEPRHEQDHLFTPAQPTIPGSMSLDIP